MGHGGRKKLRPFGRVLITIQFRDAGMLSVSEQVFGQEQAILFLAGRLVGAEDWESRSAWLKSEPKPTQPRYLRAMPHFGHRSCMPGTSGRLLS